MTAEHCLYGHIAGTQPYSVGDWLGDLAPLLGGARPIIVGGTGLYFTRLTGGLVDIPPIPAEIRQIASARDHRSLLVEVDKETTERIDPHNPARVRRAWEVLRATGRGLASWQDDTPAPLLSLSAAQAFVLHTDRDHLAERIERRTDMMLANGAIEEVRAALSTMPQNAPAMKAIGAPEIAEFIAGTLDFDAMRQKVIISTRRYAKRQRTWFRSNMRDWTPLSPAD